VPLFEKRLQQKRKIVTIVEAKTGEDLVRARDLFVEYAGSLGFDLSFQNFDRELEELPGEYASPRGCLILAVLDGECAGCAALRDLGDRQAEMKRLYVRPRFRGSGLGKLLTLRLIDEARKRQYSCIRLDTVPSMQRAIALYRSLGFKLISPYRYNPVEGALFLELDLT
jgi:putative acetyltransferase